MSSEKPPSIGKKSSASIRWMMYVGSAILLVLMIVIILSLPGYSPAVVERAKKVKALAVCTELEQAIQRFHDDYAMFPVELGADMTIDCNSAKGIELLRVLMDQEKGNSPRNAKGIKYLNVKQGDHKRDGLIYNNAGTMVTGLYDPWGGSYMIALDGNFDESIVVQPKAQRESRKLKRRVAVWSNGKDPDTAKDDVTTW